MNSILFEKDLQPEWRGMNNEYGGTLGYGEDLDAAESIPCGSWIKINGNPMQNTINRRYGYPYKADREEPQMPGLPATTKKRGRPAKADAASNAERQAKFRAKAKASGICPCCGQQLRLDL